jgi:hypothetical protein
MFVPISPTKILFIEDYGVRDSRYLALTLVADGAYPSEYVQQEAAAQEMREFFGGDSAYPN